MCTIVLDFFFSWKEAEEIKLSIYELKLRLVEVRQKKDYYSYYKKSRMIIQRLMCN